MSLPKRGEKGFTLIELLVVIALVGVVAGIAVPVISNVLQGAQTDADAASEQLEANFRTEYANFIVEDSDGLNDGNGTVSAYNVNADGSKGDLIASVADRGTVAGGGNGGGGNGGGNEAPAPVTITANNISLTYTPGEYVVEGQTINLTAMDIRTSSVGNGTWVDVQLTYTVTGTSTTGNPVYVGVATAEGGFSDFALDDSTGGAGVVPGTSGTWLWVPSKTSGMQLSFVAYTVPLAPVSFATIN